MADDLMSLREAAARSGLSDSHLRLLARAEGGGMPFTMLAAIAFRGIYLARMIRYLGLEVIEVYPAGAFRRLRNQGPAAEDRLSVLARRIKSLDEMYRPMDDAIDALCAALVAADFATGSVDSMSGLDGGIWLPGPRGTTGRGA